MYNIGDVIVDNENVNNYYTDEITNIRNEMITIQNQAVDKVVQIMMKKEEVIETKMKSQQKDIILSEKSNVFVTIIFSFFIQFKI